MVLILIYNTSWHCPRATNDLRVGGRQESRMEAKDGSFGFDFGGTYSVVEPEQRLVFTMDDGREVEVVFEENDGVTHINETFEAETENSEEMQRQGWQSILASYKRVAESM